MITVSVRLDAVTPLGPIYFIEITDSVKAIRSIAARISAPCIADGHGIAPYEIAHATANAIRDLLFFKNPLSDELETEDY